MMKKILLVFMLLITANIKAVEIFEEFYVMERIIPYLQKSKIYEINGVKVKIARVDKSFLNALKTTDDPFYFYDSEGKKRSVNIGDYMISPLTLSEIYSVSSEKINSYIRK